MPILNDVIFIDSYPKLDLHGFDRESARVAMNDFIRDQVKLKQSIVTIVHGRGTGVLKETCHQVLKRNKSVLDFKTFYNNPGCTIVLLYVDE